MVAVATVAAVLARRLPERAMRLGLCLECGDPVEGDGVPVPDAPGYRLHTDCAEAAA